MFLSVKATWAAHKEPSEHILVSNHSGHLHWSTWLKVKKTFLWDKSDCLIDWLIRETVLLLPNEAYDLFLFQYVQENIRGSLIIIIIIIIFSICIAPFANGYKAPRCCLLLQYQGNRHSHFASPTGATSQVHTYQHLDWWMNMIWISKCIILLK